MDRWSALVLDPMALVIILTGRRNDRRVDQLARLHQDWSSSDEERP